MKKYEWIRNGGILLAAIILAVVIKIAIEKAIEIPEQPVETQVLLSPIKGEKAGDTLSRYANAFEDAVKTAKGKNIIISNLDELDAKTFTSEKTSTKLSKEQYLSLQVKHAYVYKQINQNIYDRKGLFIATTGEKQQIVNLAEDMLRFLPEDPELAQYHIYMYVSYLATAAAHQSNNLEAKLNFLEIASYYMELGISEFKSLGIIE